MDLKQLTYFTAVAEEGTISAAAKKLFMTQPPLSIQLRALEQELGCTLFERGQKRIRLTDAGKILYDRAVPILEAARSAGEEVRSNCADGGKTLKIGIVSSVVELATVWLADFSRGNPDIRFEITESNTYNLIEGMQNKSIEAAIVRTPCNTEDFEEINLFDETITAVGSKSLFDGKEEISLEFLSAQPIIVYRRWADIIEKQASKSKVRLISKFVCDDARTALMLAKNSGGICIVPESAEIPPASDMVRKKITDCSIGSKIKLIYSEKLYPGHLKSFIGYIRNKEQKK